MTRLHQVLRDGKRKHGFTLVELLVAMSVLTLMVLMLFSIISQTAATWRLTKGKIETFRESRAAFTTITSQLSQATLNPYWGYNTQDAPTKYVRQSELHFISGLTRTLLPSDPAEFHPGHSVFFQAPLGFSPSHGGLSSLMNACGYFVQFGSDKLMRPDFVTAPERYRYRLMEFFQPSENLKVYSSAAGNDWFKVPVGSQQGIRVLAENVVELVILPKKSRVENAADPLSPAYAYDSRDASARGGKWHHVLPPLVDVVMVAIDEASAVRLESMNGTNPPLTSSGNPIIDPSWFTDAAKLGGDLNLLRAALTANHLNYRVFSTSIPMREANWSK